MDRMPRRPASDIQRPASPAAQARPQPKQSIWQAKKRWVITGAVLLLLLGILGAWRIYAADVSNVIMKDRYQAVFLANGQVYFGKLGQINDKYFRLTDIYYLDSNSNTQASGVAGTAPQSGTGGQPKLLKMGKEIHGPENEMIISDKQVLFFENLTPDGTVGKAIANDKKSPR